MNTETIKTAASIIDPKLGEQFNGTLAEATDAMVAYAAEMRASYGGGATSRLSRRLVNAQPDRVAEIAAVALLNLAEVDRLRDELGHAVDDVMARGFERVADQMDQDAR